MWPHLRGNEQTFHQHVIYCQEALLELKNNGPNTNFFTLCEVLLSAQAKCQLLVVNCNDTKPLQPKSYYFHVFSQIFPRGQPLCIATGTVPLRQDRVRAEGRQHGGHGHGPPPDSERTDLPHYNSPVPPPFAGFVGAFLKRPLKESGTEEGSGAGREGGSRICWILGRPHWLSCCRHQNPALKHAPACACVSVELTMEGAKED